MLRRLFFFLALFSLLTSCAPASIQPIVPSPVPQSSPTPLPSETVAIPLPSQTAEPLPTQPAPALPSATPTRLPPTSTPYICLSESGQVEEDELNTSLLPDPLVYGIYLPPCYADQTDQTYPVLYLIHGQSNDNTQWDRLGAPKVADMLITSGEVVPFIIVMPRDRVWTEPTDDNFGLAITQELVPWVDAHYRTIPDREYRAVGGLSRGGGWAVHLGLSHPELFGAFGAHSGFVFNSDMPVVMDWLENLVDGTPPRIYMDISTGDHPDIASSAIWLENNLTSLGIPHEWHLFIGYHEEAFWQSHVEDYLRWYAAGWTK